MNNLDQMLAERGKRYGSFMGHAEITVDLKRAIRHHVLDRDCRLQPDQEEALDMIAHKIGCIINGDPSYIDSWDDIAGYAKLVADRLRSEEIL